MEISKAEIVDRFKKLYTGVVSDAMDKLGMRNHLLPYYLRPLKENMVVAGYAFTGRGAVTQNESDNDNEMRFAMLEHIKEWDVPVWDCGGSTNCAHWGGLMTRSTKQGGGVGAIIDGGVRDVGDILSKDFPVFLKFYSSGSSIGRWNIMEFQKPIKIGGVDINPGDFIYGDIDGVIVIPSAKIMDVLLKAEEIFNKENDMSADMDKAGMKIRDAYAKYGVI